MIRVWRLITIVLVGLSMGMAFCHLLQMPTRMQYDVWLWKYTKGMFNLFGPSLGIILEAIATLLCSGLLILLPKGSGAFRWTLLSTVCMLIAHLAWWFLIYPVNRETIEWTKFSIPTNWFLYRALWEFTHAARAIFEIVAFILLIISVLIEIPKNGISEKLKFSNGSLRNDQQIKFEVLKITILNPFLKFLSSTTFQIFCSNRGSARLAHVHGVLCLRTSPID